MKKFKIEVDSRVKYDLKNAMDFLKVRRKNLHLAFLADYKNCLKTLKTNPFFEIRYKNVRCLPLEVFKFMIHFTVDENTNTVYVFAVISTYFDPDEKWLN